MFMEIGQYLNQRLQELGIQYIFGVPGDFNLSYLEQIEIDPKLEFIGNCNELNAAYAADGYARLHGVGALLTTCRAGCHGAYFRYSAFACRRAGRFVTPYPD